VPWARRTQPTSYVFCPIYARLPGGLIPTKVSYACVFHMSHVCYFPQPSHPLLFDHHNSIWREVQITNILITECSLHFMQVLWVTYLQWAARKGENYRSKCKVAIPVPVEWEAALALWRAWLRAGYAQPAVELQYSGGSDSRTDQPQETANMGSGGQTRPCMAWRSLHATRSLGL
jgi:hypothetical protein